MAFYYYYQLRYYYFCMTQETVRRLPFCCYTRKGSDLDQSQHTLTTPMLHYFINCVRCIKKILYYCCVKKGNGTVMHIVLVPWYRIRWVLQASVCLPPSNAWHAKLKHLSGSASADYYSSQVLLLSSPCRLGAPTSDLPTPSTTHSAGTCRNLSL